MTQVTAQSEAAARMVKRPQPPAWLVQAAAVAVSALALAAAAFLRPDPRGLGTHEQTGLPPCMFHALTGLPCPGCGMTTAFAAAVRLEIAQAFRASPFGLALAAATAGFGAFCLVCLVTGSRVWRLLRRVNSDVVVWTALGLLFASWGYKVLLTLLGG